MLGSQCNYCACHSFMLFGLRTLSLIVIHPLPLKWERSPRFSGQALFVGDEQCVDPVCAGQRSPWHLCNGSPEIDITNRSQLTQHDPCLSTGCKAATKGGNRSLATSKTGREISLTRRCCAQDCAGQRLSNGSQHRQAGSHCCPQHAGGDLL